MSAPDQTRRWRQFRISPEVVERFEREISTLAFGWKHMSRTALFNLWIAQKIDPPKKVKKAVDGDWNG